MVKHPFPRPLITLPAIRASTLFAAQEIAQPMVKIADPRRMVYRRPTRSARKAPVHSEPTKAPDKIEAVIPPCRKLLGLLKNLRNCGMARMPPGSLSAKTQKYRSSADHTHGASVLSIIRLVAAYYISGSHLHIQKPTRPCREQCRRDKLPVAC